MNEGFTHYTSAQGLPDLREAIASRVTERHEIPARAENVVVMTAKFAIYATLLRPSPQGMRSSFRILPTSSSSRYSSWGGGPVFVPLRDDFSLDPEALRAAVTPRTRMIILVSPANPTGRVLRVEEVRAALEVARDHHLIVVSDRAYCVVDL